MKKIILFIAALCCAALGVKADPLPDGLTIKLGNTYIETDDYRNITGGVVTDGTVFYDVENRTLKLYSVKAKSTQNAQPVLLITGSTEPVKIEVYGYCDFYTSGAGANCFEFSTPVIISGQSSGAFLGVGSQYKHGIVLNADMTVQDGVELQVVGTEFAIFGEQTDSKYPKLTVDGCRVISSGGTAGIQDVSALELIDCELYPGQSWVESDMCVKESSSPCKDVIINRASGIGYTYLYSDRPEYGGKLSILKDGVEQPIPFKNNTGNNVLVVLKAEDNDKFAFLLFSGIGATNPADYSAGDSYDSEFVAEWTYKLKSTQPWYVMGSDYHMYKLTDHMTTKADLGEMNSINSDHYLFCTGARREGINSITYACQPGVLQQSVMNRAFDESDLSTSTGYSTIINAQGDYTLNAMTMSEMTNTVYYAAKDNSDGKYYLLERDLETGKLQVIGGLGTMGITSPVTCMAADRAGYLYFITEHASNASLYVLIYIQNQFFFGVKQFDLGFGSKGTNALGVDPYTNEMIWIQDDENYYRTIRIIDMNTRQTYHVADFDKKPTGMFQLHEVHKVSVAIEDGCQDKGKVELPYYNDYGYYAEGSQVKLTATPEPSCRFIKWKEDGNTEAERTITVGSQDQTYTAVFDYEEGITAYPVWIDGKQVHSGRLTFDTYNSYLSSGHISFDPLTNTITLHKVNYKHDVENMIRVGQDGSDLKKVTIRLEDKSEIKQQNTKGVIFRFDYLDATFTGSGSLKTECQNLSSAIMLMHSNLAFEGVEADIQANSYGILGDSQNDNDVTVRGSNLKVQGGGSGSIVGVGSLNLEYCDMTAPSGAAFDANAQAVVVSGAVTKDQIVFTPWPQLTVEPVDAGSGKFILRSDDAEFENVGWFSAGTKVTITAVPSDGFEFTRWTHDANWGDDEKMSDWLGETITMDKGAGAEKMSALFYYSPQSDVTWYAVNNNNYVSFEMGERGAHPAIASGPSAIEVRCGDYRDGIFEYYTNSEAKAMPFDGVVDKEPMSGKDDIEKLFDVTWTVYDVSYDMSSGVMYAVASGYLYRVDYDGKKLEYIGGFYLNGNLENARCIAVDEAGTIYVLIYDDPYAKLCTVVNIDEELKKVEIEPVGQFDGSTGFKATSFKHSIAFDHATGELFWGTEDYIRKFDLETGKAYICADLGRKKGSQGVLTAMHCMDRFVKVTVKVDADCEGMGTVSVNSGGKFIAGKKATITAKENEGYQFLYWKKKNSSTEIDKNPYSFAVNNNVTYIAYFKAKKKPDQGLESISDEQLGTNEKILIDGNLYIIRDGKVYDVTGKRVK